VYDASRKSAFPRLASPLATPPTRAAGQPVVDQCRNVSASNENGSGNDELRRRVGGTAGGTGSVVWNG
jgi:hypothetical protein